MPERKYPAEPRTQELAYITSVDEARTLLAGTKERFSIAERCRGVNEIIALIPKTDGRDAEGKNEVVEQIIRLLRSDPLSDQEAGGVVRAQRLLGERRFKFKKEDKLKVQLSLEETIELQVGSWPSINDIFSRFPEREEVWHCSKKLMTENNTPATVFRGTHLHDKDVERIQRLGIIPEGLRRYTDLKSLILDTLIPYWSGSYLWRDGVRASSLQYMTERLLFSKINILHDVYEAGEFGASSPFKLGISTTTPENLKKIKGGFFGPCFVEVQLPTNRLVATKNIGGTEDERTVFYYISPESIIGIYPIESDTWKTVWEQIQSSKAKEARKQNSWWSRFFPIRK